MSHRPRYLPDRAFPAYAFVPGRFPHPVTDPRGHSHGIDRPAPDPLAAQSWPSNHDYLWGVDLYNHGYPWEAHEAWEGLWRVAERGSPIHIHLQGLIQCAAAVVKARAEQPAGVASLASSAMDYLERVVQTAGSPHMGVDLTSFMTHFRAYTRAQPFHSENWPIIWLSGVDVPTVAD